MSISKMLQNVTQREYVKCDSEMINYYFEIFDKIRSEQDVFLSGRNKLRRIFGNHMIGGYKGVIHTSTNTTHEMTLYVKVSDNMLLKVFHYDSTNNSYGYKISDHKELIKTIKQYELNKNEIMDLEKAITELSQYKSELDAMSRFVGNSIDSLQSRLQSLK